MHDFPDIESDFWVAAATEVGPILEDDLKYIYLSVLHEFRGLFTFVPISNASPFLMPLVLQTALEADTPRIVEIEHLAFSKSSLSSILFPGPFPPDAGEHRAEMLLKQLREDSTVLWLKIIDSDTGELAAFAKWEVIETPKTPSEHRPFGPGYNVEACEEFFGGIHKKRSELMGHEAHCLLDLLVTDPKYQGQGAGSMLIKWGLDIADELHVPAYLESSRVGHKLYGKFGFRDIDTLYLAPKWGPEASDPAIYFMLREAN